MLDFYGLTESYPLAANYPFMEVREGSMGRPMPGWDVQILDEDEHPVAQGERGEICLRARSNPHYPLGYWNRPEDSEEVFGGDWFHTKDAAMQDEDGYIWYAGRADDVIIAAGYRIGPFEVESACLEHPAVKEAAAVASPDELRGNVVKAFIVLAEGHEPSDELVKDIQRHVRERLSRLRLPAQDRVRRRPAQDPHGEDPPHRAARARDGGGEAVASGAMAEVREIGVVGAGFMGSGIAESAARAGLRVRVYEPSEAPLKLSKGRIEASVERAVRGGKMDEEQAEELQEPHLVLDRAALAARLGARHRGDRRGPRGQAGDVPAARRRARRLGDPRLEHLVDPDRRARRGRPTGRRASSACTSSRRCR